MTVFLKKSTKYVKNDPQNYTFSESPAQNTQKKKKKKYFGTYLTLKNNPIKIYIR